MEEEVGHDERTSTSTWAAARGLVPAVLHQRQRLRAETVYLDIVGPEQMTPEEAARNWDLPLEAVLECIDYCEKNADVLRQDWEEEEAASRPMPGQRTRTVYPLPPKS